MDSRNSATEMDNFDVDSLPNQDPNVSSTSQGADKEALTKSLKQEIHPLLKEKILEKVMSYLDVNSIKLARQVSKLWSIKGAKILIANSCVKIPLDLHAGKFVGRIKAMDKFKAFLSLNSMIPNIVIRTADDLELWKYLGVLGKQVNSLKISIVNANDEWLPGLLNLLPNLQHLSIEDEHEDDEMFKSERRQIIRVLTSVMSDHILLGLCELPEATPSDQNPLVISRIVLVVENLKDLEDFEKFSYCKNILIMELKIVILLPATEFKTRIATIVNELLSSSQKVLKRLTLICCETFLHLLDFPCMTSLTHMDLDFSLSSGSFPLSFQFSEKVPNLQDLAISYGWTFQSSIKLLFDETGSAPTVRRLKYSGSCYGADTINSLFKTFPNIKDFETNLTQCYKPMLCSLWTRGKKLKRLSFNISLKQFFGKIADLDFIFTGFGVETVNWINDAPQGATYSFANVDLDALRVSPSILNLQELENLRISVKGPGKTELPKRMLEITGEYAFKCMPKDTKIFIHVEDCYPGMKRAMEALGPVSKLPNVSFHFDQIDSTPMDDIEDIEEFEYDDGAGFYSSDDFDCCDVTGKFYYD